MDKYVTTAAAAMAKAIANFTEAVLSQDQKMDGLSFHQFPEKVQQNVLTFLPLHTLLGCRCLSKSLKKQVDQLLLLRFISQNPKLLWSPYFTTSQSYNFANTTNLFGIIVLQNPNAVEQFVTVNTPPPEPDQPPPKPVPEPPTIYKKKLPSSLPVKKQPTPAPPQPPPPPNPFPLSSVHLSGSAVSSDLLHWTTKLSETFGMHLTSLTLDLSQPLTCTQLRAILVPLQNLIHLSLSLSSYSNPARQNAQGRQISEQLPPIPSLIYLHLPSAGPSQLFTDLLSGYGTKLKRLTTTKNSVTPPTLTLHTLLVTSNVLRPKYPSLLFPLEELKLPHLASDNLMSSITPMAASSPILWSNLKRLSLFYVKNPLSPANSALSDLFEFFNVVSPTLEEVTLTFQDISGFQLWIGQDSRPLSRQILQSCRKTRKLCLSANCLSKCQDIVEIFPQKFPRLRKLTFFNWKDYLLEQPCGDANLLEKLVRDLQPCMEHLKYLQRVQIRKNTWKEDGCVWEEYRETTHVATE